MLSLSTCEDTLFEKTSIVKLGDYEIDKDKIIAEGGFSKIYLGLSKNGGRVCVKAMTKSSQRKQLIKMAKQEAKILSSLSNPSICQLITTFESQNHYYILSKYYQGPTLSQYLLKKQRIRCEEVQLLARQLIKSLYYLHEKKIMHRDLKPQNMIYINNKIVILDFGFACRMSKGQSTILCEYIGTPSYMSPELLQRKKYNSKSDIWSFGMIVYQMLYGKLPWSAKCQKQLIHKIKTQKLKFQAENRYPLTQSLRKIITYSLQIDPQKRISWKELLYFNQNLNKNNITYELIEDSKPTYDFCGCKFFT